jgi:hypothetical protein
MLFTPHRVVLTSMRNRNTSISQCTLQIAGGKSHLGEIPEHEDGLTDVKSTLRVGYTLVPLIFISDGTHLFNFASNMQQWPVYRTISNVSSKIRQMPSTHCIISVTLLPIQTNNDNIPQQQLHEQRATNGHVLNEVFGQVLQPLTIIKNSSTEIVYYNILCADGNIKRCKPVLAAWLAHCPEYRDLHHLE